MCVQKSVTQSFTQLFLGRAAEMMRSCTETDKMRGDEDADSESAGSIPLSREAFFRSRVPQSWLMNLTLARI